MRHQLVIKNSPFSYPKLGKKEFVKRSMKAIDSVAFSTVLNREGRRIAWKSGRMRINFIVYVKVTLRAAIRKNPYNIRLSLSDAVIDSIPRARHMGNHTLGHARFNKYFRNTYQKATTLGTFPFSRARFIRLIRKALDRLITEMLKA